MRIAALWMVSFVVAVPFVPAQAGPVQDEGQKEFKDDFRVSVKSIESAQKGCRVTIEIETGAEEGTVFLFRFLPVACWLDKDGGSFVFATQEKGSVFTQAAVEKGTLNVSFMVSRMTNHQVRITPADTNLVFLRTIPLFDPKEEGRRLNEDLAIFTRNEKTVADYIDAIEPYSRRGEFVPLRFEGLIRDIRGKLGLWVSSTDISASASVLGDVTVMICGAVPWDREVGPDSGPKPAAPPPENRGAPRFDVAPFRTRLLQARPILYRECALRIVSNLRVTVAGLAENATAAEVKAARATVKELDKLFSRLNSGELSDAHNAYPESEDLDALVKEVAKAVDRLTDAPKPQDLQDLKALVERMRAAEQKLAKKPKEKR